MKKGKKFYCDGCKKEFPKNESSGYVIAINIRAGKKFQRKRQENEYHICYDCWLDSLKVPIKRKKK